MFTGIVQTIGRIKSIQAGVFCFEADPDFFTKVKIGDSIAVDGVCLTATKIGKDYFKANVSTETIQCSIFADLTLEAQVNLEKSVRLNQGIDGHLVSGHIDGTGAVVDKYSDGDSVRFKIKVPQNLVKYIARKGSICMNGVSLTVNKISKNIFEVNIVPHTLNFTTLGQLTVGDRLNIEVDMIARQLEQLLKKP